MQQLFLFFGDVCLRMCVCVCKDNLTHPEAVDQVVSGEQLIHQELQRVFAARLVQREDIK